MERNPDTVEIRPIDASSACEIEVVATRMRQTLVEVLGEAIGGNMYSMDWLKDRVMFHLDPARSVGQVFVAVDGNGLIAGHTIVRVEQEEGGGVVGLFSTIFVASASRNRGVATSLLDRGEAWMKEHAMGEAVTYTAPTNEKLKNLFTRRGYSFVPIGDDFIRLSKSLGQA